MPNILNDLITNSTIPIKSINVQVFNTTGAFTYTPTAGMVQCVVEAQAGGGGGGGSQSNLASTSSGGNGGGGGGYACSVFTAAQIGASKTGTIGVGGTGGAGIAGTAGGSTTFSTFITCTGGAGGTAVARSTSPKIGSIAAPGIGSGGNVINLRGMPGEIFTAGAANGSNDFGAAGGGGLYGLGGPVGTTSVNATAAVANSGAGGGGASSGLNQNTGIGGNGGSGKVIIWELIGSAASAANNDIRVSPTGIIYETKTTVFASTTTWVPDSKTAFALVKVQGIGGTGGTAPGTTASTLSAGGGGGGGGFAMSFFTAAQITALPSKAITISSAVSSLGSTITCNGGSNGENGFAIGNYFSRGGGGGAASGGNVIAGLVGSPGAKVYWNWQTGVTTAPGNAVGGNGYMGKGGGALGSAGGTLTGGGGSGQSNGPSAGAKSATPGGTGFVEIIEFLRS